MAGDSLDLNCPNAVEREALALLAAGHTLLKYWARERPERQSDQ
jgi:hypothetical protein